MLITKALVGTCNKEKPLVGALSLKLREGSLTLTALPLSVTALQLAAGVLGCKDGHSFVKLMAPSPPLNTDTAASTQIYS